MLIEVSKATGSQLDCLVAIALGYRVTGSTEEYGYTRWTTPENCELMFSFDPSSSPSQGHHIIDLAGISVIRADDDYDVDGKGFCTNKRMPVWAATIGQHSKQTSYEGEYYPEPQYEIAESDVVYGPTMLIAAMRCFVIHKLGKEVTISKDIK